MSLNRRSLLGNAALGAGGLIAMSQMAHAETPAFKAGDGGVALDAVQLPPGELVVYHSTSEVDALPEFKYSLDGGKPKVSSGGWAKESTVAQLPISKGIAGVHMFLDAGASRELHWHAIAAEWAYVMEGECQSTAIDPSGQMEVANFGPGDLWYFPRGHGHSIQTIGSRPCHFILSFDNGAFSEQGTFSVTDWISGTPDDMLASSLGVSKDMFAEFPKGETYIMAGPVLAPEQAKEALLPPAQSHKFSLLTEKSALRAFEGGSIRLATANEFPVSQGMSGGVMTLKPGAVRELHWHPNANEWHYYLKGTAQVALFGSGGRHKVAQFGPGDVAYLPRGYGHAIKNIGKDEVELVLTFDSGEYQEISLANWLAASPKYLLTTNFARSEAELAKLPPKSAIIRAQI